MFFFGEEFYFKLQSGYLVYMYALYGHYTVLVIICASKFH